MQRWKGKRMQGLGRKPEEVEVAGTDTQQWEHGAQASPRPWRVPGARTLAWGDAEPEKESQWVPQHCLTPGMTHITLAGGGGWLSHCCELRGAGELLPHVPIPLSSNAPAAAPAPAPQHAEAVLASWEHRAWSCCQEAEHSLVTAPAGGWQLPHPRSKPR